VHIRDAEKRQVQASTALDQVRKELEFVQEKKGDVLEALSDAELRLEQLETEKRQSGQRYKSTLGRISHENKSLSLQAQNLQVQVSQLESERAQLENQALNLRETTATATAQLKQRLGLSQKKLDETQHRNAGLHTNLDEARKKIAVLDEEVTAQATALNRIPAEREVLKKRIRESAVNLMDHQKAEALGQLTQLMDLMQSYGSGVTPVIDKTQARLNTDLTQARAQILQFETTLAEKAREVERLKAEQQFSETGASATGKLKHILEQKEGLTQELERVKTELADAREKARENATTAERAVDQVEIVNLSQSSLADKEIETLKHTLEETRAQLEAKTSDLTQIQERAETGGGDSEQQIREIKSKFAETNEELQKKSILLAHMKDERESRDARLKELEDALEASQARERQAMEELERERVRLELHIQRLNERINQVTARIVKVVG